MKKIVILLCLGLVLATRIIWSPVSAQTAEISPIESNYYPDLEIGDENPLMQHFVADLGTVTGWRGQGHHTFVRQGDTAYIDLWVDQDQRTSTLQAALDEHGQPFPLESDYVYLFDFSLVDYTPGDQFELLLHRETPNIYNSLECTVVDGLGGLGLSCQTIISYLQSNERRPLYNYDSGPTILLTDAPLTLRLTRDSSNLTLQFWYRDQAEIASRRFSIPGFFPSYDTASLEQPMWILRRSQVSSDKMRLRLHSWQYAPYDAPVSVAASKFVKFSQRDSAWSSDLLGHSQTLTLENYGCYVTSLAMLLRFYGYSNFLDDDGIIGSVITPGTLNQWLRAQKDGFVNQTYVNTLAVTRLVRQLHDRYARHGGIKLPKLEYEYRADNGAVDKNLRETPELVLDQTSHNQPAIVQILNHFVVGTGVTGGREIKIADPYYADREYLQDQPLSVRRFIPSYTDLSYFAVNVIGQASVSLAVNDEPIQLQADWIYDPVTNEITGTQYLLAKPASGDYVLDVAGDESTAASLFVYNTDGEVTVFEEVGRLEFTFDREAADHFAIQTNAPPDDATPPDTWQSLQEVTWQHQYVRLTLNYLHASGQNAMLQAYLADYKRRGLIGEDLAARLQAVIEQELAGE